MREIHTIRKIADFHFTRVGDMPPRERVVHLSGRIRSSCKIEPTAPERSVECSGGSGFSHFPRRLFRSSRSTCRNCRIASRRGRERYRCRAESTIGKIHRTAGLDAWLRRKNSAMDRNLIATADIRPSNVQSVPACSRATHQRMSNSQGDEGGTRGMRPRGVTPPTLLAVDRVMIAFACGWNATC